jgi:N-dimethylarginine dimethylaminohydrolase
VKLLLCPPDYYGIEYEINPWMRRSRQSDRQRARVQWEALRGIVSSDLGVSVESIQAQPGLPDMVFTANAGVVWNGKFIVSRFKHQVRQREVPFFEAWFQERDFEIVHLPPEYYFEGEGDLLPCGQIWFAGYHIRSDVLAHQKTAEIIDREILSLELTSEWFYHLDTCFCPLSDHHAMFYPQAFDSYAQKVLEHHIPELIPVSTDEAERFACNAIVSEKSVVMNSKCPKVRADLERAGFRVLETPLDEFIKAGGSAKCLVLRIG